MKIVVEKATRKAFYLFSDDDDSVSLGEYLFSRALIAADINAETHEIIDGPPPDEWIGGGALAFDGKWSIADQEMVNRHQQLKTRIMADDVRAERNSKLSSSDWTQIDDAPVDKAAWAEYRQALRDLTIQDGFPFVVIWPEKP